MISTGLTTWHMTCWHKLRKAWLWSWQKRLPFVLLPVMMSAIDSLWIAKTTLEAYGLVPFLVAIFCFFVLGIWERHQDLEKAYQGFRVYWERVSSNVSQWRRSLTERRFPEGLPECFWVLFVTLIAAVYGLYLYRLVFVQVAGYFPQLNFASDHRIWLAAMIFPAIVCMAVCFWSQCVALWQRVPVIFRWLQGHANASSEPSSSEKKKKATADPWVVHRAALRSTLVALGALLSLVIALIGTSALISGYMQYQLLGSAVTIASQGPDLLVLFAMFYIAMDSIQSAVFRLATWAEGGVAALHAEGRADSSEPLSTSTWAAVRTVGVGFMRCCERMVQRARGSSWRDVNGRMLLVGLALAALMTVRVFVRVVMVLRLSVRPFGLSPVPIETGTALAKVTTTPIYRWAQPTPRTTDDGAKEVAASGTVSPTPSTSA